MYPISTQGLHSSNSLSSPIFPSCNSLMLSFPPCFASPSHLPPPCFAYTSAIAYAASSLHAAVLPFCFASASHPIMLPHTSCISHRAQLPKYLYTACTYVPFKSILHYFLSSLRYTYLPHSHPQARRSTPQSYFRIPTEKLQKGEITLPSS
jgi:hypothetical protein